MIISDSKIEWFAPPKYADFRTSEISVEVTEPVDDVKIEFLVRRTKGAVHSSNRSDESN